MARSKIAITSLTKYNTSGAVVADAVELTDGNYLDLANVNSNKLLVTFTGKTASMTATFKKGIFSGGVADLVVTVGATAVVSVVVESSSFKDASGYILIDCAGATANGTIQAVELPN